MRKMRPDEAKEYADGLNEVALWVAVKELADKHYPGAAYAQILVTSEYNDEGYDNEYLFQAFDSKGRHVTCEGYYNEQDVFKQLGIDYIPTSYDEQKEVKRLFSLSVPPNMPELYVEE